MDLLFNGYIFFVGEDVLGGDSGMATYFVNEFSALECALTSG